MITVKAKVRKEIVAAVKKMQKKYPDFADHEPAICRVFETWPFLAEADTFTALEFAYRMSKTVKGD